MPPETRRLQEEERQLNLSKLSGAAYNPFNSRNQSHKSLLTDFEVLIVLGKSMLGFSFLRIPYAFSYAGSTVGVVITILAVIITTHCNYLWVRCAHEMYYRSRVSRLTYEDVIILVFTSSHERLRRYTILIKCFVQGILFITYFLIGCMYILNAVDGFYEFLDFTGRSNRVDHSVLKVIDKAVILTGVIIIGFIPDLKKVSKFSMYSMTVTVMSFTYLFYLIMIQPTSVIHEKEISFIKVRHFFTSISSVLLTAGVILPLENEMKNPTHLISDYCFTGINNLSLTIMGAMVAFFGIYGYEKFGNDTCLSILSNLLMMDWRYYILQLMMSSAMLCTLAIPYYIMFDILWRCFRHQFLDRPTFGTILIKMALTTSMVLACEFVEAYVKKYLYITAGFCAMIIGMMLPATLEMITYWNVPSYIPYLNTSQESLHSMIEIKHNGRRSRTKMILKDSFIIIYACFDMYCRVAQVFDKDSPPC